MNKSDAGLTEEQWKELEELRRMPDQEIDTTDIPVTLDWKNMGIISNFSQVVG